MTALVTGSAGGIGSAIVAKLLHQPLEQLRREAASGFAQYYAGALRELFGLEEEDP